MPVSPLKTKSEVRQLFSSIGSKIRELFRWLTPSRRIGTSDCGKLPEEPESQLYQQSAGPVTLSQAIDEIFEARLEGPYGGEAYDVPESNDKIIEYCALLEEIQSAELNDACLFYLYCSLAQDDVKAASRQDLDQALSRDTVGDATHWTQSQHELTLALDTGRATRKKDLQCEELLVEMLRIIQGLAELEVQAAADDDTAML